MLLLLLLLSRLSLGDDRLFADDAATTGAAADGAGDLLAVVLIETLESDIFFNSGKGAVCGGG